MPRSTSRLLGGLLITLSCLYGVGCAQVTDVQRDPAPAGIDVTIKGAAFGATQGLTELLYDDVPMSLVSWADTSIVETLPFLKADGTYSVSVVVLGVPVAHAHTISNPVGPVVSDITPDPAAPGDSITLTGQHFGALQGASEIAYDGSPIAVTTWSETSIVATLPGPKADGTYTVSVVASGILTTPPHTISNDSFQVR